MKQGFSLVELSIVLVILGLLTGGILGGQELIRAAEMRAIGTEVSKFQTATNTFRDKYFAMPGDMANADRFWGYPGGSAANCPGTAGSGTETCNGNGDGDIDTGSASQYGEVFLFWQHLANAGLIEGQYTGMAGSGSGLDAELGGNSPRSKLGNAGWTAYDNGTGNATYEYTLDYGNTLEFGEPSTGWETGEPALTPEEAWSIDTKVDDGQPARGKVIARFWDDECGMADDGGSAATDLEASYNVSADSKECALFVRNVM